jgi:hypothetical protein
VAIGQLTAHDSDVQIAAIMQADIPVLINFINSPEGLAYFNQSVGTSQTARSEEPLYLRWSVLEAVADHLLEVILGCRSLRQRDDYSTATFNDVEPFLREINYDMLAHILSKTQRADDHQTFIPIFRGLRPKGDAERFATDNPIFAAQVRRLTPQPPVTPTRPLSRQMVIDALVFFKNRIRILNEITHGIDYGPTLAQIDQGPRILTQNMLDEWHRMVTLAIEAMDQGFRKPVQAGLVTHYENLMEFIRRGRRVDPD